MMSESNHDYDEKHEIIIVGAGVSGLMLAKLLNNSGIKALLLERKTTVHIRPETFGTFTVAAREHHLTDYIDHYFDTFTFYGATSKASATEKNKMCLVNYQKWAHSLKLKNITIRTDCRLIAAQRTAGGIVLRERQRSYFARMVVDCSGYAQIVAKLLGLRTITKTGLSFGVELTNCRFPIEREASFILNTEVANSGGWLYIFPNGKGQYGWADFYPESKSSIKNLRERTLKAMRQTSPHNAWLQDAHVTCSYGRFGPTGSVKHQVGDNFIAIGDAGGCGTPVTLEGFRQALDSAKFAHQAITLAADYKKASLSLFLKLFHAKYGKYYRMHQWVKFIYLRWANNTDIDRWIHNFSKLDGQEIFRLIMGELTPGLMLKTLDIVLVKNIFLNIINNLLPTFLQFRPPISLSKKESMH
ncbi:MAG: NAD(P)/FAD-dependent oxidoreductase [Deltaproteobacteria bacterium]|nr:NAD(P)/FAD-dependent oxidoreductase [Deltaproteobacteria bacterium]